MDTDIDTAFRQIDDDFYVSQLTEIRGMRFKLAECGGESASPLTVGDAMRRIDLTGATEFVVSARLRDRRYFVWRVGDGVVSRLMCVWATTSGDLFTGVEEAGNGLAPDQFIVGEYFDLFRMRWWRSYEVVERQKNQPLIRPT